MYSKQSIRQPSGGNHLKKRHERNEFRCLICQKKICVLYGVLKADNFVLLSGNSDKFARSTYPTLNLYWSTLKVYLIIKQ